MSDIIYTPPASGGGGGQNPTTNYIPLNNGTSNFVDSSIYNDLGGNFLQTEFNSVFGLYLIDDGSNVGAYLGDFNYNYHGAYIQVNDTNRFIEINASDNYNATSLFLEDINQIIRTRNNGNDKGLKLDFVNNVYTFGDMGANRLYIDGNNTYALMSVGGNQYLLLDALNNYGAFLDYGGGTGFEINGLIKTFNLILGNSNVFSVDYSATGNLIIGKSQSQIKCQTNASVTTIGDVDALNNHTILNIDDVTNEIYLKARVGNGIFLDYSSLRLDGPTSPTASGVADHLEVIVNGSPYKIQLLNP